MWPIVATSFLALCTLLDRVIWWLRLQSRMRAADQVRAREALGVGDFAAAWKLGQNTDDPYLINLREGMTQMKTMAGQAPPEFKPGIDLLLKKASERLAVLEGGKK